VDQQGIDIDPWVGQQPVHLLAGCESIQRDRMLGQASAGQRQALADHGDCKRGRLDHPKGGPGQRKHALGM